MAVHVTMVSTRSLIASLALASVSVGSVPPTPDGRTVINSTVQSGAYLSYKETKICETTEGVKSYAGYVHLPPNALEGQNYAIHTFFWFFESRKNPANSPLSVWLQGGPGSPTVVAAISENGPCSVNNDSATTELNPWSWNNEVNMLYIDQPVQTGFSYDTLHNGTLDELFTPFFAQLSDFKNGVVPENTLTTLAGTFYSESNSTSANTTMQASRALWHFLQTWTSDFPEYKSNINQGRDTLSIWGESYGGHYGPITADYISKQNALIQSGKIAKPAKQLHVETLGLVNACIDGPTQIPLYPQMAYNNTYNLKTYNESTFELSTSKIPACLDLIKTCQNLADERDPEGFGNNPEVNFACHKAYKWCFDNVANTYPDKQRNIFDIASPYITSFPPKWPAGYLNRGDVQQALGVPLNFTGLSWAAYQAFPQTGDFMLGHGLEALGRLLDAGTKIALVYGDRDYQCNWLGGEAISLHIPSSNLTSADFAKAGYAKLETNSSYTGGWTRQHGRLSFSRVFNAGHAVPYYQPETAYQIFNRVMANKDVATGSKSAEGYVSSGEGDAWGGDVTAPAYDSFRQDCYLWDIMETCTADQAKVLKDGKPIVKDFVLVGYTAENGTEVIYPQYAAGTGASPTTTGGGGPSGTSSPSTVPSKGEGMMVGVRRGLVGLVGFVAVWLIL